MQEIHKYLNLVDKCKSFQVKMNISNDSIILLNKKNVILGKFFDVSTAYSYILGYESGIMDAPMFNED